MEELKRVAVVIVAMVVIIGAVLGGLGIYYYTKINRPVKAELEGPRTYGETETTVKVPAIVKPFVDVISDIKGKECGDDLDCFNEAAQKCKKTKVVAYLPKVTQLREIVGEEDGRCIVNYNNTAITDLAEPYWLGLTMTCKLLPQDVDKDFLEWETPDCSGPLWDRLEPALR